MPSPTAIVDPFGLWPWAARLGRQTSVVAADTAAQTALVLLDRVLASPRSEQAMDLVLAAGSADQAVRSVVRGPLVEAALRTAVAEGLVERISAELVDSGAVDRVFDHLVSTEVLGSSWPTASWPPGWPSGSPSVSSRGPRSTGC